MRKGILPALYGLLGSGRALARAYPHVELVYQYLPFDRTCEQWLHAEVEDDWIREIEAKLAFFQAFWDGEAPALLGTTVSETGMRFRRREVVAVLSLCMPTSMSTPLIVSARRFLDGPTQGKPSPMHQFSALVYHELLHSYIPYPLPGSRMMEKYRREPPMVLTHIHLMALLKHVYLKLRREDQLEEIIAHDSAAENPIYRRGWQIVNDVEGHHAFVGELKAYSLSCAKRPIRA
jgi:hypothetical protein